VTPEYLEEEEMDISVVAKWSAMSKFVNKVSRRGLGVSHIMSVGDSYAEAEALKEISWSSLHTSSSTTLRMLDSPSLKELTSELEFLVEACPVLLCGEGDTELHMESFRDTGEGLAG